MGGEDGREEESSSERRRDRVVGWERRLWIVVRRRMAVVSLPAVMLEVVHAVRALEREGGEQSVLSLLGDAQNKMKW